MSTGATDNRKLIEAFIDLFMRELKVREAFEKYVHDDYVQHRPGFPDGREGTILALEALFAGMGGKPIIHVKRILVDGDFAAVHIHGRSSEQDLGIAGVDLFRIESGKIVEHWEVVQPVPQLQPGERSIF